MSRQPGHAGAMGSAIATALRAGTLISMAIVLAGGAWALLAGGEGPIDRSVVELIVGGGPDAVIGLGLLGLTLVPIVVVGITAVNLRRTGEDRLAWFAVGVLALLLASLVAAALIGALAASP